MVTAGQNIFSITQNSSCTATCQNTSSMVLYHSQIYIFCLTPVAFNKIFTTSTPIHIYKSSCVTGCKILHLIVYIRLPHYPNGYLFSV